MTLATPSTPLTDVLAGLSVIDCDTHFTEPPDLWTSRAPAKFKERVPQLKRVDGEDRWYVEGYKFFGDVGSTVVGIDDEKVYGPGRGGNLTTWENLSRAAYDPKARVELMDRLGLWAQIVYPNAAGLSSVRFIVRVRTSNCAPPASRSTTTRWPSCSMSRTDASCPRRSCPCGIWTRPCGRSAGLRKSCI